MRIAIDAHVITGKFQGTRTTLTKLLQALSLISTDNDVFVYVDDVGLANEVLCPNRFNLQPIGKFGSIARLTCVFPKLFRQHRIELGIFQYNIPFFSNVPCLVFIHDILPITHKKFFPIINRLRILILFSIAIRRSLHVITVSEYGRQAVLGRFPIDPSKVSSIPNGPSFEPHIYFDRLPRSPDSLYILTVGRIEARKNIDMLIHAFQNANLSNVTLKIVGKSDLGYNLDIKKCKNIENIVDISDGDLIDLYRSASLFVYPSFAEGFGIPLLDSLLFGLPVISSDRTAMKEIGDGIATMFDPTAVGAEERLTELILGHFTDRPIPAPTSEQRNVLQSRFNWDNAAQSLMDLVDRIARL